MRERGELREEAGRIKRGGWKKKEERRLGEGGWDELGDWD